MIPLRVSLKGFMSYREEQTLLFDGAPLWVLTGPNGAGKSAIFDAITFALYGRHRAGSQNARDLINHGADALRVEFDFAVDGTLYRVRRLVPRRGQATREAFWLIASVNGDKPHVEPIPGTDTDRGFDEWVARTIGLKYETFTSSVLLLQGDSEKLLRAEPRERYRILAEILDLTPYQRLAKAADDRRGQFESQAKLLAQQLQGMPVVTEPDLESALSQVATSEADWGRAQAKVEELVQRLGQARHWEQLTSDLCRVRAGVEQARSVLSRGPEIQQGFARWKDLEHMVPILTAIVEQRRRAAEQDQRILGLEHELRVCEDSITDGHRCVEEIDCTVQRLESTVGDLHSENTSLMRRLAELAPLVTRLEQIEGTEVQIRRLESSLKNYPADLADRLAAAEARERELAEIAQALPWLADLAQSRSSLATAVARKQKAVEDSEGLVVDLQEARAAYRRLEGEVATAREEEAQLAYAVTRAETAWQGAGERLSVFQKVASQPTCGVCGQPITADHAQQEAARLTALVQSAEDLMRAQRGEYQKAKKCLEQAEASLRTKDAELRALVESEKTSQREHEQAGHDMTDYARRVRSAYDNLPAGLQVLVADVPASEPIGWLESRYPTEADLQVSAGELASRAAHAKSLQQLRLQMEKWQQLDGQLQEARRSLAELRALCPTEEAQLARQENTVLTRRQTDIVSQMGPQEKALAKARAGLTESRGVLEKRRAQLTEVGTRLAVTRAKRDEIEQNIRLASASAPSEWQKEASLVDADRLKALEVEQAGKAQYSSLAAELERATQSIADGEDQIARLGSQIAGIPDPSQRPSGEVEKELATCRSKSAQADTERRQTHAILDRLRAQYEHRKEQEEAHRDVDRQHHLFKVLSTLLGPSGLQLHLLRRAEGVIVALANEALDGLSRGQMRLELRRSQEDGEQSSKALDLMIYNYDTGTRPTAVALASGSQQFRIAVSLALAIGRYAGQEARHVESVIIDEGFGSLDKSARDDMIQELNQLQQQLARVILVSHQEEFAGAFASGYTISLEDNASRVTLLEPA